MSSEAWLRKMIANIGEVIVIIDGNGINRYKSPNTKKYFGWNPEELVGQPALDNVHPDDLASAQDFILNLMAEPNREGTTQCRYRCKDGSYKWIEFKGVNLFHDPDIQGILGNYCDITEQKQRKSYREMSREILQILNRSESLSSSMHQIIAKFKKQTGFDAIGIRLKDGDDFPYFAQEGFPDDFLLSENTLIERTTNDCLCRNEAGEIDLECTCGLVISGKVNQASSLFTEGGSFWTNDSEPLLQLPDDQDPRHHPRNLCIHKGYASVALVPIRSNNQIVGLIQFNDHHRGCFTLSMIELLEEIASHIGEALMRKKAEEDLRQERLFSKLVLESFPGIFYLYTYPENRLVMWNKQHETVLGFEAEEMKNRLSTDWHRPEAKEAVIEAIEKVMRVGYGCMEDNLVAKDGHLIPFFLTGARFEANGQSYLMGIGIDMTERNKAIEELRRSEESLRKIASQVPGLIYQYRMYPDGRGCMPFTSQAVRDLFQVSSEEVSRDSSRVLNTIHPDDYVRVIASIKKSADDLEDWHQEFRVKFKDDTILWLLGSAIPQREEDGSTLWHGFIADITNLKKTEKVLIEAERMSATGEMASSVAHDFNNALQMIFGNLEMASLVPDIPQGALEFIESAGNAATAAASRVRLLQRCAKKGNNERHVAIDINQLLKEAIFQASPLWKDKAQRDGRMFLFQEDYGKIRSIDGDVGEIGSVFHNLLKNSIEAMLNGGKISIKTGVNGKEVYVRITDTGMGMSEETRKRIFQPFFSTKGLESGRGLGMYAVYSIIKDHGGKIDVVETVLGKGTTIEVTFPFGQRNGSSVEEDAFGSYQIAARVLLVDDEDAIRGLMKRQLESMGHFADTAGSGQEALDFLHDNAYDLVITDIGMPGMSGWQLAGIIKSRHPGQKVAIVSGWGASVTPEEREKYGVGYVLGKPTTMKELRNLVGEVLQSKI